MKSIIYFNSLCGTCRKTLALLEERGLDLEIREYLTEPPTKTELLKIMEMLGDDAQKIVRTKEQRYKELNFSIEDKIKVAEVLSEEPVLIQRPIFIHQGKAVVARPPEEVLKVF